jgi:hypothetical protein
MPDHCAMSHIGTAQDLEHRFWDLLYRIKFRPVVVGRFKLDYVLLKNIVAQALYDSIAWPAIAILLQGLFNGEATSAMESIIAAYQPTTMEGRLGSLAVSHTLSLPLPISLAVRRLHLCIGHGSDPIKTEKKTSYFSYLRNWPMIEVPAFSVVTKGYIACIYIVIQRRSRFYEYRSRNDCLFPPSIEALVSQLICSLAYLEC